MSCLHLFLVSALLCLWALPASAQCSDDDGAGSGTVWTCLAGTTPAQMQSTLTSGSLQDGATLNFESGSYTWGGAAGNRLTLPATKAVTLACPVIHTCDITWTVTAFTQSATSTKAWRITGFEFINTNSTGNPRLFYLCEAELSCGTKGLMTIGSLRIDHNLFTITSANGATILNTTGAGQVNLRGVFDHNEVNIDFVQSRLFDFPNNLHQEIAYAAGTAENFYIEDNIFTVITGSQNGAGWALVDGWGAFGHVWRFNTINEMRLVMHGADHVYGPYNWEVYGNRVNQTNAKMPSDLDDCYRAIYHQGSGQYIVWGNEINCSSYSSGNPLAFSSYRSFNNEGGAETDFCNGDWARDGNRQPEATYEGYPCYNQPGRDYDLIMHPMAFWLNVRTDTGAKLDMNRNTGPATDYTTLHVVPNRDYYIAVSATANSGCPGACTPFDGTVGIGHGELAQRPTTCTVGPTAGVGGDDEGKGGVMYWATDQGSWNSSSTNPYGVQQNGADGVLYMCTATNTWSVYYTPYTYPHPLQGGAAETAPRLRFRFKTVDNLPLMFAVPAAIVSLFIRRRHRR